MFLFFFVVLNCCKHCNNLTCLDWLKAKKIGPGPVLMETKKYQSSIAWIKPSNSTYLSNT